MHVQTFACAHFTCHNVILKNHGFCTKSDAFHTPDRVYSWQIGREVNNAWFSTDTRIERYAPWYAAEVVCFYPSVFDVRGVPAGTVSDCPPLSLHLTPFLTQFY